MVWDYMYVWTYSRAWLDHHLYSVKVGLEYKLYLEVIIVRGAIYRSEGYVVKYCVNNMFTLWIVT